MSQLSVRALSAPDAPSLELALNNLRDLSPGSQIVSVSHSVEREGETERFSVLVVLEITEEQAAAERGESDE